MQSGKLVVCLAILCALCRAQAEDVVVASFESSGQIAFQELTNAVEYRVEWAPSPAGTWATFTGPQGQWLDAIPATGEGLVTASVPMLYRIVATLAIPPMVRISGTSFIMGAATNMGQESYMGEIPQHAVTLDAFDIGTREVTKREWDQVYAWATNNGYAFDNPGSGRATNHPVQFINWYDAVKWCNARSEQESLAACYASSGQVYRTGVDSNVVCNWTASGYRLPTEAEWECAARGGVAGHRFPWSDSDEIQHARANYVSTNEYAYDTSPTRGDHPDYMSVWPYTAPAETFAPNGYGLYQMAGNVHEWCWDKFEIVYYASSPSSNPRGPDTGRGRVIRGGDWMSYAFESRVAFRRYDEADMESDIGGFRVVRRAE